VNKRLLYELVSAEKHRASILLGAREREKTAGFSSAASFTMMPMPPLF
jgi:hypothetical protein